MKGNSLIVKGVVALGSVPSHAGKVWFILCTLPLSCFLIGRCVILQLVVLLQNVLFSQVFTSIYYSNPNFYLFDTKDFNLKITLPGLEEGSQSLKIRLLPGNWNALFQCIFV